MGRAYKQWWRHLDEVTTLSVWLGRLGRFGSKCQRQKVVREREREGAPRVQQHVGDGSEVWIVRTCESGTPFPAATATTLRCCILLCFLTSCCTMSILCYIPTHMTFLAFFFIFSFFFLTEKGMVARIAFYYSRGGIEEGEYIDYIIVHTVPIHFYLCCGTTLLCMLFQKAPRLGIYLLYI